VGRIPANRYAHVVDALILCSGISLVWAAFVGNA